MAPSDPAANPSANTSSARPITVRKLVALDIVLHGYWFILIEFGLAIGLGTVLGLWISYSVFSESHPVSPILLVLGAYFLFVAINYAPLLLYAITIVHHNSARAEVAAELAEGGKYAWQYGVRQLWLVVPLVMPVLAVTQELRTRSRRATGSL
jgi:hypothetical protein